MNDLRSTRAALQPGDLIGSTFLTTDAAGQRAVYTTFGEYVAPNGAIGGELPAGFPRYGYAGEHGYEEGHLALSGVNEELPPLTLLHVGERWYDPALGRFLQRDPIGLPGGLNTYAYCDSHPTTGFDPPGTDRWVVGGGMHRAVIIGSKSDGYTRFDFGPDGGVGAGGLLPGFSQPGRVAECSAANIWCLLSDDEKLLQWRPTDEFRDRWVKRAIRNNKSQPYNIWHWNCRHFTYDVFYDD